MLLDDLGLPSNFTIGGATIAGLLWIWRLISGIGDRMTSLELKVAENYVTRPELKVLEDKLDRHNEILNNKVDNVNNNLLTLSNLLANRDLGS